MAPIHPQANPRYRCIHTQPSLSRPLRGRATQPFHGQALVIAEVTMPPSLLARAHTAAASANRPQSAYLVQKKLGYTCSRSNGFSPFCTNQALSFFPGCLIGGDRVCAVVAVPAARSNEASLGAAIGRQGLQRTDRRDMLSPVWRMSSQRCNHVATKTKTCSSLAKPYLRGSLAMTI